FSGTEMGRLTTIGLNEQIAYMRMWWPTFSSRVCNGILTAEGELHPSELCATYRVRITLAGGKTPEVRVIHPGLRPRQDERPIPHMYAQERLCLYLPGTREWTPEKPIAVTILPWASLWLYFYEVWHATGEWLGGGTEPEPNPQIR